jgi:hypothetical protein
VQPLKPISVTAVTLILTPRTENIATQLRGTKRQMKRITVYHNTYPEKESLA